VRPISIVNFACLLAGAYVFWPFHTVWSIKEAVKNGDSTYLAEHFEWHPVKETLKESMGEMVFQPVEETLQEKPERQGLWNSIKTYYGRTMVDQIVERYANPTGLPRLFSYGRTVREDVLGKLDPDEGKPLQVRIADSWARIDRATFVTPTRFEIDMRDKYNPRRVYAGVLELKNWRWTVTELRVHERTPRQPAQLPQAKPVPSSEVSGVRFTSDIATR